MNTLTQEKTLSEGGQSLPLFLFLHIVNNVSILTHEIRFKNSLVHAFCKIEIKKRLSFIF